MTRMSKQAERRAVSPRKRRRSFPKTGSKRDRLEFGYRLHENAVPQQEAVVPRFFPKQGIAK